MPRRPRRCGNKGDVITPKISNVRLLAAPSDGAQSVTTVNKGDALVVIGAEQKGYVYAQGSAGSGRAKKVLMMLH